MQISKSTNSPETFYKSTFFALPTLSLSLILSIQNEHWIYFTIRYWFYRTKHRMDSGSRILCLAVFVSNQQTFLSPRRNKASSNSILSCYNPNKLVQTFVSNYICHTELIRNKIRLPDDSESHKNRNFRERLKKANIKINILISSRKLTLIFSVQNRQREVVGPNNTDNKKRDDTKREKIRIPKRM